MEKAGENFSRNAPSESGDSIRNLPDALRGLEEIAALHKDWDSFGGEPPSETAIVAARKLIEEAYREKQFPPYFVAPLSGGGVQLEWRGSCGEIEVEVGPQGVLGYLLVRGKGTPGRRTEEENNVPRSRILQLIHSVS